MHGAGVEGAHLAVYFEAAGDEPDTSRGMRRRHVAILITLAGE